MSECNCSRCKKIRENHRNLANLIFWFERFLAYLLAFLLVVISINTEYLLAKIVVLLFAYFVIMLNQIYLKWCLNS